ncbi:MAG TPA: hypothetical protein VK783_00370 [Bacteroidia bacterium]|jgi:hypothetical protein|nr:hypothetical protein [Bacteroidia bacterium]
MNNKQIEAKLEEIEQTMPQRFTQYKLKDHMYWAGVPDTNTLKWGFHPAFLGNLPGPIKVEVSKIMNKLTKNGYVQKVEKAEAVEE